MPFELEFEETFAGDALNLDCWLPCYLPHWSTRKCSAARYLVGRDVGEDHRPRFAYSP